MRRDAFDTIDRGSTLPEDVPLVVELGDGGPGVMVRR